MRILVPIWSARMDVDTITGSALQSGADTIAVGLLDGETDVLDTLGLRALLDRGEAKSEFRHLVVGHAGETDRKSVV